MIAYAGKLIEKLYAFESCVKKVDIVHSDVDDLFSILRKLRQKIKYYIINK